MSYLNQWSAQDVISKLDTLGVALPEGVSAAQKDLAKVSALLSEAEAEQEPAIKLEPGMAPGAIQKMIDRKIRYHDHAARVAALREVESQAQQAVVHAVDAAAVEIIKSINPMFEAAGVALIESSKALVEYKIVDALDGGRWSYDHDAVLSDPDASAAFRIFDDASRVMITCIAIRDRLSDASELRDPVDVAWPEPRRYAKGFNRETCFRLALPRSRAEQLVTYYETMGVVFTLQLPRQMISDYAIMKDRERAVQKNGIRATVRFAA